MVEVRELMFRKRPDVVDADLADLSGAIFPCRFAKIAGAPDR